MAHIKCEEELLQKHLFQLYSRKFLHGAKYQFSTDRLDAMKLRTMKFQSSTLC